MTRGVWTDRRRITAAVVAVASVLSLATGCGKGEFTYVTNSDDRTYFKVPSAWAEVDGKPVDDVFVPSTPDSANARALEQLLWSTAFDASNEPTADHMISLYPTAEPVVYSLVFHLPAAEQDKVSFDYLRDFFFPVTDAARERFAQAGIPITNFELLNDEILAPSDGLRGVRVIYNYEFPRMAVHTFDLTAYTNNDSSDHLFLVDPLHRALLSRARGRTRRHRDVVYGEEPGMSLAPTTPVEGLRPPDQGPENRDRPTRPKLKLWDRIRFLVLFTVVWFTLVWAAVADNPILPFAEAMRLQFIEAIRSRS